MPRKTKCLTIEEKIIAEAQKRADGKNISLSRHVENLLIKDLEESKKEKNKQ